jgi:hypothetical protein
MWEKQTSNGKEIPLFQNWAMVASAAFVFVTNFIDCVIFYCLGKSFVPGAPYTILQIMLSLGVVLICIVWIILFVKMKGPKPLKIIGSVVIYLLSFYYCLENNIRFMSIDKSIIS